MSRIDFIGNLLDLKDPNITFGDNIYSEERIKNILHKILHAKLIFTPQACYKCGHSFDKQIIKHKNS